ncbi:hypothetical protein IEQ34_009285 [Dendrobium chrysotoxum]|uniref:non-specific serine/threonine protein kinase n=1 Tax=Dendrobium chrysotoxum TaxID=161865 RepID=A0AAV7H097_DENCH|nr:hypothetical protein IEQ34_009285 [Dendrobium chrysotoxum]
MGKGKSIRLDLTEIVEWELRDLIPRESGEALFLHAFESIDILNRDRHTVEHVRAERNLLAEVASHCIVKLYYSFQDADYLYLIMEYLPGGDMMTVLTREEILTENVARFYIAQIVLAIESIHKHNYIHSFLRKRGEREKVVARRERWGKKKRWKGEMKVKKKRKKKKIKKKGGEEEGRGYLS